MKKGFQNLFMLQLQKIIIVECSFEWNAGYSEEVLPFTNNIPQKMEVHLLGFRSALTRVINKYSGDRSNKKTK